MIIPPHRGAVKAELDKHAAPQDFWTESIRIPNANRGDLSPLQMLENFLSWTVQARNWNSCTFFEEKPLKKLKLYFLVHHAPVAQQGLQTKGLLNIYLLNLASAQFQDSNTQHFSSAFPGSWKLRDYLSPKLTQGYKGTEILPLLEKKKCNHHIIMFTFMFMFRGGSTTGQIKNACRTHLIEQKYTHVWEFFNQENLSYISTSIKLK